MSTPSNRPIHGIIVPLASPLTAADRLDESALEKLVDHVIAGGVDGLFLLGTCGEGVSLSHRLQRQLVERVCRQAAGRVAVLVCVTDVSSAESGALAQFAADAGADFAVAAPPFYLPLSQQELADYAVKLAARCPLPLVLYNMPDLTKVPIEPATVRRLMDQPRIVGIKDSSGDLAYFEHLCRLSRQRTDWSLLMGPEHLLADAIALGAQGGVAGGANLFPRLFVDICNAARSRDPRLARLVELASRLNDVYGDETSSAATVIKGLKAGLAALGIGNGLPAEPLAPLPAADQARVESTVRRLAQELR
ncbi:MAG: dihydrodipicolinate synthase family protein [Planctomycetota bacterium]|nr:MAG: dihydrodipicolinate synthase family protein [Planctomycetota bacterium]